MCGGLIVSLRQPASIQPHWAIRWSKYGPPMYPGSRSTLLVVTTKEDPTATEDGTRWNCQWLGNPPTILPHFLSSAFLISCAQRRDSCFLLLFFWRVSSYIHPKAPIFFFFLLSFRGLTSGCWTKDTERQPRGNGHCVTNPIRSNKKTSTIFYRHDLKIVDETLVGRLTKRKRRKKRNAIIP